MMPARWARGATPRIATGALLLALGGTLTGCAGGYVPAAAPPVVAPTVIPQPAAAPQAAAPAEAGDPCPYLSNEEVAALAGDQRTQLVGSASTCGFNIGGQFNYQIDVMSNDGDRFNADKATFFKDATAVAGVGDEAFFRNGTAITVLGVRKGNSYFTVTLVPAVADPNVGPGAPAAPANAGADAAALVAAADTNGDGVVDADTDGDGIIDTNANQKAIAAADTNGDGTVDAAVAEAVAAEKGGNKAVPANNAKNTKNAKNAALAPVTDIDAAKARMTDVAKAVANSL
jgi:Protein of unknown function (DUF3558)